MRTKSLALVSILCAAMTFFSCAKNEDDTLLPQSHAQTVNTAVAPQIIWGTFDGGMYSGHEGALKLFTSNIFTSGSIIIVHPSIQNGFGSIRYDAPSAECFRSKFEAHNAGAKESVFVTNNEEEFTKWYYKQLKNNRVVVSYKDGQGNYYGVSYTVEEWNDLYGNRQ